MYKISIIYTFTNITDNIPVLDDYGDVEIIEIESYKQYNCDMSENVAKKNSKFKCCSII